MFKLSKMADYSVSLLSEMNGERDLLSVSDLAGRTGLPDPTVAKLMRLLVKANIVSSVRGVQGGYKLKMRAEALSVENIIMAVDGKKAVSACTNKGAQMCTLVQQSPATYRLHKINGAVKAALQNISLKDLQI